MKLYECTTSQALRVFIASPQFTEYAHDLNLFYAMPENPCKNDLELAYSLMKLPIGNDLHLGDVIPVGIREQYLAAAYHGKPELMCAHLRYLKEDVCGKGITMKHFQNLFVFRPGLRLVNKQGLHPLDMPSDKKGEVYKEVSKYVVYNEEEEEEEEEEDDDDSEYEDDGEDGESLVTESDEEDEVEDVETQQDRDFLNNDSDDLGEASEDELDRIFKKGKRSKIVNDEDDEEA